MKLMGSLKFARLLRMLGFPCEGGSYFRISRNPVGPSCSLIATDRLKRAAARRVVKHAWFGVAAQRLFRDQPATALDG